MDPFIGEIRPLAFFWPPREWAQCNGTIISLAQNMGLAGVIGNLYGGDGSSTIGLPNLQGRVPVGMGSGPGLTPHQIANTGGVETVTLSGAQMAPHKHPINSKVTAAAAALSATPNANMELSRTFNQLNYSTTNIDPWTPTVGFDPSTIGVTGGSPTLPHNNMQPWLCINFCIALDGVFPLRQ